jgi:hypothetical protein
MNIIFILIGMSTIWLFMYKIEWLFQYKTLAINIAYNIILIGVSFLPVHSLFDNPIHISLLRVPLFSSIVFIVLYLAFKAIYRRNPHNTFWTFSRVPIQDVAYSVLFWLLGGGLPLILVGMNII